MRIRLVMNGPREAVVAELDRLGHLYEVAALSEPTPLPGAPLGGRPRQYMARMMLTLRDGESGDLVPVRVDDARRAVDALRVTATAGVDLGPELAATLAAAADRIAAALTPETADLPALRTPGDPDHPLTQKGSIPDEHRTART